MIYGIDNGDDGNDDRKPRKANHHIFKSPFMHQYHPEASKEAGASNVLSGSCRPNHWETTLAVIVVRGPGTWMPWKINLPLILDIGRLRKPKLL